MTGLLVVVLWSVSDTMGGTTIRRLANPDAMDASVQRFVIPRFGLARQCTIVPPVEDKRKTNKKGVAVSTAVCMVTVVVIGFIDGGALAY